MNVGRKRVSAPNPSQQAFCSLMTNRTEWEALTTTPSTAVTTSEFKQLNELFTIRATWDSFEPNGNSSAETAGPACGKRAPWPEHPADRARDPGSESQPNDCVRPAKRIAVRRTDTVHNTSESPPDSNCSADVDVTARATVPMEDVDAAASGDMTVPDDVPESESGDEWGHETDKEDTDDTLEVPLRRGTSRHGFVDAKGRKSNRLTPDMFGRHSDNDWSVSQIAADSPYAEMVEAATGYKYVIRYNRVGKAKLQLSYASTFAALSPTACSCSRSCFKHITIPDTILGIRSNLLQAADSEAATTDMLAQSIFAADGKFTLPQRAVSDKFRGGRPVSVVRVCRKYYALLHGVSEGKLKTAMKEAKKGPRRTLSGEKDRREDTRNVDTRQAKKSDLAFSFWDDFFRTHCQRPNDETRLFPTEKTVDMIYDDYFDPWFSLQVTAGTLIHSDKPSLATFKKAKLDPKFNDVKKLKKHRHGRCKECEEVKSLLLKAYTDGALLRQVKQRKRLHEEEVKQWRQLEASVKSQGTSSPGETMVLMHDGTQSFGLPRLGHRAIKNLDPFRFEVTPWLSIDFSSNDKDYIYAPSFHVQKDTNYLISQLHAMIRRGKSDYNHPRHAARKLICIADSASENKNNTLFAYFTDMVNQRWFDEVVLLFGPVGHTHNGVDALHKIHNQNVAAAFSGDLGHLVQNYPSGFSTAGNGIPNASILGKTVDWISYYENCVRYISGFKKSLNDPVAVRGFRIARETDGTVQLKWKRDPALETEWRGRNGCANTPGFYMLKQTPEGLPKFVGAKGTTEGHREKCQKLLAEEFKNILQTRGSPDAAQWNYDAATTGQIPVHRYIESSTPAGTWGRLAEIGSTEDRRANMRLVETYWNSDADDTHASLWMLPIDTRPQGCGHAVARSNEHHPRYDRSILQNAPIPAMRYRGESARSSSVASHPQCGASMNSSGDRVLGGWVPYPVNSNSSSSAESQVSASIPSSTSTSTSTSASRPSSSSTSSSTSASGQLSTSASTSHFASVPRPVAPGVEYTYEEAFLDCKEGKYVVMLLRGTAESWEGEREYIEVGQIISVDSVNKTFTYKRFYSSKNTWMQECVNATFSLPRGGKRRPAAEVGQHYSVISYFDKWNGNGRQRRLPARVKNAIRNRVIRWTEPERSDDDDSSYSESE